MEEVEAPPFMEKKKSRFRRVCVFCGSSPGKKAAYQAAAVQLGQQLVEHGIGLVYGGGSVGLMGLVSHAVHNAGGHVIGYVRRHGSPNLSGLSSAHAIINDEFSTSTTTTTTN
jgi:cytokinin riboside 5'-monophosphate phosphoribohydrolase